jgi:hypothetical protein
MKLPAGGGVLIEERKVLEYLLSRSHPVGRFKARVFAALGFEGKNGAAFIGELRRIAAVGEVSEVIETSFGQKYTVPGDLKGPLGELPVLTVWFLERGQERARLVTVRPRKS